MTKAGLRMELNEVLQSIMDKLKLYPEIMDRIDQILMDDDNGMDQILDLTAYLLNLHTSHPDLYLEISSDLQHLLICCRTASINV